MEASRPDVALVAASDHLLDDPGGSSSRGRWKIGHEPMVPISNVGSNGDLSPNSARCPATRVTWHSSEMAKPAGRAYVDDVPDDVIDRLRAICTELPDAYEEQAWVGVRWRVRTKTFAHVLAIDDEGVDRRVVLTFRSEGDELEVLRRAGPPFRFLGWGRNALGVDIDEQTDWDELRELVTDSYCVLAPKKLVALVNRPPAETDDHGPDDH